MVTGKKTITRSTVVMVMGPTGKRRFEKVQ
jgi:hypothetical protein